MTNEYHTQAPEFALTPIQLGMVYESVLAGYPGINLEQVVVHLDDEHVAPDALRDAWRTVAYQHEALRLRILWRGREKPVQVIAPTADIALTVEDWHDKRPDEQQAALQRFLHRDRQRGVDLEAAASWRVTLLQLGPRRNVMVWTIHHALVDGRSMAIVLEDMFATLSAPKAARSVGGQGANIAAFCEAVNNHDTADAQAYFSAMFDGFEQPNALAQVSAHEQAPTVSRKLQIERVLDAGLTEALTTRAEQAGATLATLVHAVWGLVVARWTGQRDAVFGVTRAGRYLLPGCERLVGCLINTLPARVDTRASTTIDDLFQRLRAATVAQRPHEHASLTHVRDWIGLPASVALFESMVMFERASLTRMLQGTDPSWEKRRVDLHEEGALPLTLAVYADPNLKVVLEHDPVLVPADRAEAMLGHFTTLLTTVAQAKPGLGLSALSMLPPAEEAALMALASPARPLTEAEPCIATRFEAQVAATPTATALTQVGGDGLLDFDSLDKRANGLAHHLIAEGAGPGQIVAISLDRSPDFVVAMLAILKAGAAFLPVDPGYPAPVKEHMVTDSGARLMIARTPEGQPGGLRVLSPNAPPRDTPPPRPAPDPDRLAYVIYTSGSTGKPKGVRVPQRAISAHATAIIDAFALTQNDRCLQFASLSFDVSIEEMLPTLIAGAALIMRDDPMAQSISVFLDQVQAQRLSVLNLPTAFWHILVDDMVATGRPLPDCVRLVIAGGEAINPKSLASWQRVAPGVRWLNGYGPTETTITCTLHEPGQVAPGDDIPIGRPTLHARAYVLAADGSLAPRGCPGDLWIGGPAVSDGYIGRPEQTAQVFRPDHLSGQGRIYHTGDRAHWRADGTLAFMGRQDRQVKLRGFRIDLRQIESVLEREDGVGRALVRVVDADAPGARLVAWVAGADGLPAPEVSGLQQAATRSLPPHMVPAIVTIAEFPRTPGGKIDTKALPLPARPVKPDAAHEPADARTQAIAAMMASLLRLDAMGPDDSFHAMGGHSLLAVRLIGKIEAEYGKRLAVGDLHRNPTPRALSAALDASSVGPRYIIPIQPNGTLPPLFGVHVLGANEVFYRPLAALLRPDQPVMGLSVGPLTHETPIGVAVTARAYFDDIQQHYPEGPISLAAVSLGSYIAFELAQLLHAAGREVRMLAFFDAAGPAGRSRIKGAARLLAHLRQLRQRGLGHAWQIVQNRKAELVNLRARTKLTKALKSDTAAPLTLDAFVAANEMAVEAYEARPITIPITIFRAQSDVFDSVDCYSEGLGWAAVAKGGFNVIDVPGDHLSILEEPNVPHLAGHILRELAKLAR